MTKTKTRALSTLKKEGAELVGWYHSVEESKTDILKRLAEVVVEVRSQFHDEETGQPDWRGKSWEYRQFMTELYEAAGVPPASVAGVQSSLRYHTGNRLREVVPPEELERAGLLADSPKLRMEKQRNFADALYRALNEDSISKKVDDRRKAWRMLVEANGTLTERLWKLPASDLTKRDAKSHLEKVHATKEHLEELERALLERLG